MGYRREIIETLKNSNSMIYEFDLTLKQFEELETYRVEFSHQVGRIIGDAKMDIFDAEDGEYKILRINRACK